MNLRYNNSKYTIISILFIYIFVGVAFAFSFPSGLTSEFATNYAYILFSYFLIGGIWFLYINRYGIYLFEPISIVMPITLITFSVEPLVSIITDDLDVNGFYVYDGCKMATTIYMLAAIAFLICYYKEVRFGSRTNYVKKEINEEHNYLDVKNKNAVIFWAYIFAILGTSIAAIDLIMQGYSFQYIVSLGTSGTLEVDDSSLGFFINLRYCAVPAIVYLYIFAKNKIPATVLLVISAACMFMRNKRAVLIVLIGAPIVYYYVRAKRTPKKSTLLIAAIIGAIVIGGMQYMRYDATSSLTQVNWDGFTLQELWKGFSGNFDLYKTLYAAVVYFPEKHFFTLGQQLVFLTLVTAIPRAIWPGKPISIFETLKAEWLGQGAITGAWAYAQITEFYVEYGTIGAIVLMGIFGKICRNLKKSYRTPKTIHSLVAYSVTYPMLMQFVIRGYMPINFWIMFFMLVPVLVIKGFDKIEERES